jgi:hypothetical protein
MKIGRFPLNPGYSRVFPHNEFGKKFSQKQTKGTKFPAEDEDEKEDEGIRHSNRLRSAWVRISPPGTG